MGGRVFLDYPVLGGLADTYVGAEAGAERTPGVSGWQPEVSAIAGVSVPF